MQRPVPGEEHRANIARGIPRTMEPTCVRPDDIGRSLDLGHKLKSMTLKDYTSKISLEFYSDRLNERNSLHLLQLQRQTPGGGGRGRGGRGGGKRIQDVCFGLSGFRVSGSF